ncbi:MAG: hypothetical protein KAH08_03840 [Methylococcales bacterium]|nr:hypothetical protein [Methylococcales bacterium]
MLREDYIAKRNPKQLMPMVETIILTILGIFLGFLFTPTLNFFTTYGFSWIVIGPFLAGLRYGFAYAINSTLLVIAVMGGLYRYYYPDWDMLAFIPTMLGIFFISITAGEFRNYSERKIKQLQVSFNYTDQRLGEVTNAFNLLKISHERLAQQTASKSTLRDSLLVVREHVMRAKTAGADLNALILRVFSDYGSIQQAGVYTLDHSGHFNNTPIASIGGEFKVNPKDLLLQKTLTTLQTTMLKPSLSTEKEYSDLLLLVIPIVDVFGKVWGIVLVNKMPFRAFRADNINLLSVLGGHIADLISMVQFDDYVVKNTDLQYFILQTKRCIDDAKAYSQASSLVGIHITNNKESDEISHSIMSSQRGLDSAWNVKNNIGQQCIFVLLPLTDFNGVEGYKLRLQQMLEQNYGYQNLAAAEVMLYKKNLVHYATLQELMFSLFELMNINESLLVHQNYGQKG